MTSFFQWLNEREGESLNPYGVQQNYNSQGLLLPKPKMRVQHSISPEEQLSQNAIPFIQKAKQSLQNGQINNCGEYVLRAMQLYTSSGPLASTKGDQFPTYKMLNLLYNKLTKEKHPIDVYQQMIDIALRQLGGDL